MTERKCLQCYEQLRGRTDQKFCNDQCRSAYNNHQNLDSNAVIKLINRILKKNYSILADLNSKGKVTVPRSDLQKKGFRFEYFTCTATTRNSRMIYFCYDHGFREHENDKIMLIRRAPAGEQMAMGI